MYTTKIVDREAWYIPFIAPKEKSVTWWLFSVVLMTIAGFFILLYAQKPRRGSGIPEERHGCLETAKKLRNPDFRLSKSIDHRLEKSQS